MTQIPELPEAQDIATITRHAQDLRAAYLHRLVARGGRRMAVALQAALHGRGGAGSET